MHAGPIGHRPNGHGTGLRQAPQPWPVPGCSAANSGKATPVPMPRDPPGPGGPVSLDYGLRPASGLRRLDARLHGRLQEQLQPPIPANRHPRLTPRQSVTSPPPVQRDRPAAPATADGRAVSKPFLDRHNGRHLDRPCAVVTHPCRERRKCCGEDVRSPHSTQTVGHSTLASKWPITHAATCQQ